MKENKTRIKTISLSSWGLATGTPGAPWETDYSLPTAVTASHCRPPASPALPLIYGVLSQYFSQCRRTGPHFCLRLVVLFGTLSCLKLKTVYRRPLSQQRKCRLFHCGLCTQPSAATTFCILQRHLLYAMAFSVFICACASLLGSWERMDYEDFSERVKENISLHPPIWKVLCKELCRSRKADIKENSNLTTNSGPGFRLSGEWLL